MTASPPHGDATTQTATDRTAEPPAHEPDRDLLVAAGVDFAYGDVEILQDVSLTIESGAVTALIGPNGSGKTTLLRALAGLHEQTAGEITYHGPESVRRIGYLPQQPAFRPGFTVLETLRFYASLVGAGTGDARTRLERIGLADAADRPVDALSGGMTRLAGIAQATIGDPPLIVLDEPASGLDPSMSGHVFEVAAELAAGGTGVLLSSHDLELVERTADHVIILDDGTVQARGAPAALVDEGDAESLRGVYEASTIGDDRRVRVRGETS